MKPHEKGPIWAEVLTLLKGEGMDLAEDGGKNSRHPASPFEQTIKYHCKDHKDRVSFLSFTG